MLAYHCMVKREHSPTNTAAWNILELQSYLKCRESQNSCLERWNTNSARDSAVIHEETHGLLFKSNTLWCWTVKLDQTCVCLFALIVLFIVDYAGLQY